MIVSFGGLLFLGGWLKTGLGKDNKRDFVYCDAKVTTFNQIRHF
jgi:hypothetical protein